MEQTDVQRMADSVLREYGVPLRVAGISAAGAGWTIAFAGTFPGAQPVQVNLRCDRVSPYLVRESLKRSLSVND
jgi:hypothetical protein